MALFLRETEAANAEALALFRQAAEREPDYALAHGMQAWCHYHMLNWLWHDDPKSVQRHAQAASERAIMTGTNDPSALVAASTGVMYFQDSLDPALNLVNRALELDPNNAWGWLQRGWANLFNGDHAEAERDYDKAATLSPADPFTCKVFLGRSHVALGAGDIETAIKLRERAVHAAPHLTGSLHTLAALYSMQGNFEKAKATMARFLAAHPDETLARIEERYPAEGVGAARAMLDHAVLAGLPRE